MKSIKNIILVAALLAASALNGQILVSWGDSLAAGDGGLMWTRQFTDATGIASFNGGVGGTSSTSARTAMLARPDLFDEFVVIWTGRNNFNDPATVQADIAAMVGALTTDRYVVMSILNASTEPVGTTAYNRITALNADLAATYGTHYLDIRSVLVSQPTFLAQDILDEANGVVPFSYRADHIHLNTLGYGVVAQAVQTAYFTAIPEPSTYALMAGGLALLGAMFRRK